MLQHVYCFDFDFERNAIKWLNYLLFFSANKLKLNDSNVFEWENVTQEQIAVEMLAFLSILDFYQYFTRAPFFLWLSFRYFELRGPLTMELNDKPLMAKVKDLIKFQISSTFLFCEESDERFICLNSIPHLPDPLVMSAMV